MAHKGILSWRQAVEPLSPPLCLGGAPSTPAQLLLPKASEPPPTGPGLRGIPILLEGGCLPPAPVPGLLSLCVFLERPREGLGANPLVSHSLLPSTRGISLEAQQKPLMALANMAQLVGALLKASGSDSWSGHVPCLWAPSPVWVWARSTSSLGTYGRQLPDASFASMLLPSPCSL